MILHFISSVSTTINVRVKKYNSMYKQKPTIQPAYIRVVRNGTSS